MKESKLEERICPICGKVYRKPSALSRVDNKTPICPDCGTREALQSLGISAEEQNEIMECIHRHETDE